jgi:hypothetical protein
MRNSAELVDVEVDQLARGVAPAIAIGWLEARESIEAVADRDGTAVDVT